jgi:hypothetical protein
MLSAYGLAVDSIGKVPLGREEEAALVRLVDAIASHVTLVVSRPALEVLFNAIDSVSASLDRERLRERVTQELSNGGPGLHVLQIEPGSGMAHGSWKSLSDGGEIDAVVTTAAAGASVSIASCGVQTLDIVAAARLLQSTSTDLRLDQVCGESHLRALFQPLFRFGNELVLADPYLGAESLRAIAGDLFAGQGLAFVVDVAAEAVSNKGCVLTVGLVACRKKLEREVDAQLRRTRSRGGSLSFDRSTAAAKVESFLRTEVCGYLEASGRKAESVRVAIHWTRDFADRGCISSRRVWVVEHSLRCLHDFLDSIRTGARPRRQPPRLRLVQNDGAVALRRIVAEARQS